MRCRGRQRRGGPRAARTCPEGARGKHNVRIHRQTASYAALKQSAAAPLALCGPVVVIVLERQRRQAPAQLPKAHLERPKHRLREGPRQLQQRLEHLGTSGGARGWGEGRARVRAGGQTRARAWAWRRPVHRDGPPGSALQPWQAAGRASQAARPGARPKRCRTVRHPRQPRQAQRKAEPPSVNPLPETGSSPRRAPGGGRRVRPGARPAAACQSPGAGGPGTAGRGCPAGWRRRSRSSRGPSVARGSGRARSSTPAPAAGRRAAPRRRARTPRWRPRRWPRCRWPPGGGRPGRIRCSRRRARRPSRRTRAAAPADNCGWEGCGGCRRVRRGLPLSALVICRRPGAPTPFRDERPLGTGSPDAPPRPREAGQLPTHRMPRGPLTSCSCTGRRCARPPCRSAPASAAGPPSRPRSPAAG
jgi:hypothetical protein